MLFEMFRDLLLGYASQIGEWDFLEHAPSKIEGLLNRAVLSGALADKLFLEAAPEFEVHSVASGEFLLANDRGKHPDAARMGVATVQRIGQMRMVIPRPSLADSVAHQAGERWQYVDRRVDSGAVKIALQNDLALVM